jgi:uncharacterized protein YndB with AHSA1/START domain
MAREVAIVERTLVKSPPELWELLDDPELMRRWTGELEGSDRPPVVAVAARSPGERLAWRSAGRGAEAEIELVLAEKGWGTNVSIRAECEGDERAVEAVLERLLDELSSPQRRPFTRA